MSALNMVWKYWSMPVKIGSASEQVPGSWGAIASEHLPAMMQQLSFDALKHLYWFTTISHL